MGFEYGNRMASLENQNSSKRKGAIEAERKNSPRDNVWRDDKKSDGPLDPDRRKFLGFMTVGAAAAAALAINPNLKKAGEVLDYIGDMEPKADATPETAAQAQETIQPETAPEPQIEKIPKEVRMEIRGEIASVRRILSYDAPGKFEFTEATHEKIKNYWKDQYNKDPGLRKKIDEALGRMEPWEEELKKIFREKGLPEKFSYLAIPESFFDPEAISPAKAVGPYQFMESTAQLYELDTDKKNDERKDPIKSGKAAAECLRDNYNRCRDLRISLSGYNGKYAWDYLKKAYANRMDIAFKYLLSHQANSANFLRDRARGMHGVHKIEKGDGLLKIARDYGITMKELCDFNSLTEKSIIRRGQTIKIPIPENRKKDKYEVDISSLRESLEYPAKCEAFFEIIEKIKSA